VTVTNNINTEHSNGGSRTPRFFRVEMDNDTAKRVKVSNEQYTTTGSPKLPERNLGKIS